MAGRGIGSPLRPVYMSNPLKIALIGRLGSGKSYVANHLCNAWGARKSAFATQVYRVAEDILGRSLDKSNPAERQMLTDIGTEWGRLGRDLDAETMAKLSKIWPHKHGYPEVWIDAFDRAHTARTDDQPTILDDLRFANELRYLLRTGFTPILVTCSDATRADRLTDRGDGYAASLKPHASEALSNHLTNIAIDTALLPVLWNDDAPKPSYAHIFDLSEIETFSTSPTKLHDAWGQGWDALLNASQTDFS